jgi:DeoR family transcriptional regulator, fructose operon transcriptional repressor
MTATPPQSPHERLREIEQRITERGSVRIDELAPVFGVREMTVRRDLDELESLGLARRVRGGAVAGGPEPFADRHRSNAKAKGRIAEKLTSLVPDRGTVAFDASTTVHRFAAALEGARDLIVVTNGIDTFQTLAGKAGITPTLTGGAREPRTGSLVGPLATRSVVDLLFDVFVTSAAALDPELGASEASIAEADVKRAIRATSGRVVLAVDSSKLGSRAQARVFQLSEVDLLVTELDPDDARLSPYRSADLEIR